MADLPPSVPRLNPHARLDVAFCINEDFGKVYIISNYMVSGGICLIITGV